MNPSKDLDICFSNVFREKKTCDEDRIKDENETRDALV